MQLKNIKEDVCVDCGAPTVSEAHEGLHTNGYMRERRKFSCRREIEFSPNFMQIVVHRECENSKTTIEKEQKQKAATLKLKNYINKLDVDDEYKRYWLSHWRLN